MAEVTEASCSGGNVTLEGSYPEPDAEILSEGVGNSDGLAVISNGKIYYLTSNATDLKETIDKLINSITELTTALTAIDAKPTGGSGSSSTPVAAANVVSLTAISTELTALKEALK